MSILEWILYPLIGAITVTLMTINIIKTIKKKKAQQNEQKKDTSNSQ